MPAPDTKDLPSPATANGLADHQPGKGSSPISETEGNAGELHQDVPADADHDAAQTHLTDNFGHRISDNQNSLKAGERGPTLLEDFVLREKIFHFLMGTSTQEDVILFKTSPVAVLRDARQLPDANNL